MHYDYKTRPLSLCPGEQTELYQDTSNTPSIILTNDNEDDEEEMEVERRRMSLGNEFPHDRESAVRIYLPSLHHYHTHPGLKQLKIDSVLLISSFFFFSQASALTATVIGMIPA